MEQEKRKIREVKKIDEQKWLKMTSLTRFFKAQFLTKTRHQI